MKPKLYLLLIYIFLTATLAYFHEPWRDEADNWLMARDASVPTILSISPDSGTPPLWYLVLKPFATHGFPFFTQAILNLIIVWIATAFLIFQSPFSISVLACLCFSWFLSFEYSVVARNYGLGILGLFLLMGSWASNLKRITQKLQFFCAWPLLCFSSVHFLSLCPGLLCLDYLLSQKKEKGSRNLSEVTWIYLWPIVLFGLSVWVLWPTGSGQMGATFIRGINLANWFKAMSMAIFPFFSVKGIALVLSPFIIFKFFRMTQTETKFRRSLYLMFWAVNGIFIFKYFNPAHRFAGFNWLLLLVSATTGFLYLKRSDPFLSQKIESQIQFFFVSLALINSFDVVTHWIKEINLPFTDAYKTARFLETSGLSKMPMACFSHEKCSSILGYFKEKTLLWYPGRDEWGTHGFWDRKHSEAIHSQTPETAFERTYQSFLKEGKEKEFVYISIEKIEAPLKHGFQLAFCDEVEGWLRQDEVFCVYRHP